MNALVPLPVDGAPVPVDSGEDAGSTLIDVGLMRLCGCALAVPAGHVREVVPLPATLQPSFSGSARSAGSIVIRGRVIPVLDIADELGLDPAKRSGGVVLILRHDAALIGIIMDSVSGLARIAAGQVQPLLLPGGEDRRIVTCSFPLGESLVGLIDPAAVFALPGVPHAREERPGDGEGAAGSRRAAVLIEVAGTHLAIDSALVVATVPSRQIVPSPASASKWIGSVRYLGQEIPVIDDLALLGLSGCASDAAGDAVILLRFDEARLLGLKIDRVKRIRQVNDRMIRPLPQSLAEQLTLFCGAIVDHEGTQNLLVDKDALIANEPLRMIARLTRRAGAVTEQGGDTDAAGEERQPFLVFVTGGRRRATPLAAVKQIIPLPSTQTGLARAGSGLQGMADYNGAPLPLMQLAGGEGHEPDESADRVVLVVERNERFTGLMIDRLETVARSVLHRLPGREGAAGEGHFIDAQIAGKPEAVRVCDLAEELAQLA